jgi:hypothetical protein
MSYENNLSLVVLLLGLTALYYINEGLYFILVSHVLSGSLFQQKTVNLFCTTYDEIDLQKYYN